MWLHLSDDPQIHTIYRIEAMWLYTFYCVDDHPNHRFGIVTDQYDLLEFVVLKSDCNSIINIFKNNYLASV